MDIFEGSVSRVIASAVDATGRYPFLFIGSGLSRRYMGAPSWEELLGKLAEGTVDRLEYARLRSRATTAVKRGESSSVLPLLAGLMEDEVNDALLTRDEWASFREAHEKSLAEGASPMRLRVADLVSSLPMCAGEELSLLRDAGKNRVSGVITTNYDRLCEEVFPKFDPYVGEDGLIFRNPSYAKEIYKIHGSVTDPESIVITEADYDEFARKGKYLAAKILTVFMEYPVVFLGYSIQDENIQSILSDICTCIGPSRLDDLKSRLIFVQYSNGAGASIGSHSISVGSKVVGMTLVTTEDFSPIYKAILNSRKLYNIRFIREIKDDIYRLASGVDADAQIVVAGVDQALRDLPEDRRVVLGIGVSSDGLGKPIDASDIYEDAVTGTRKLDPKLVVETYLERLLASNPGGLPVYKYLSMADSQIGERADRFISEKASVGSFRNKTLTEGLEGQRSRFSSCLSVDGLIDRMGRDSAFKHVYVLEAEEIDVGRLSSYLFDLYENGVRSIGAGSKLLTNSEFKRCVRILDFVRYGKEYQEKRKPPDHHH